MASLAVVIIWIVSYLETLALKKQIVINSDSLYMHDLARDMLNGGSLLNWNLTQAPDYFPHMLAYIAISTLTSNAVSQLFLITLFQVISLSSLLYIIFRELGQKLYNSVLLTVVMITLINLFQLNSTDWIYFYKTNNHFSTISMGLFAIFLLLRSIKSDQVLNKRLQVLIFLTIFLGTISTITYIYAISIPVCMVLVITLHQIRHNKVLSAVKSNITSWLIILPISTIFSLLLVIGSDNSNGLRSRLSLSNFDFNKIQGLVYASFYRNVLSSGTSVRIISLTAIFAVSVSLFFYFFTRKEVLLKLDDNPSLVLLFQISVTSLITSLVFTFLSGGIVDEYFLRYFWPAIFTIMVCVLIVFVHIFGITQKKILTKLRIEILLVSILLIIFGTSPGSIRSSEPKFLNTAQCIQDLRRSGVNLKVGVADYWFGRSVDYLTRSTSHTYVALNSLDPFYWMTTDNYYKEKNDYNFLLLHSQPDQFGFNFENMKSFLPNPSQTFKCPGTDIVIFFYDNGALNGLIQKAKRQYFDLNSKG